MSELSDLYQEVILDHNRSPRNFGPLEGANHEAHGDNPLCGDTIDVRLLVTDGVVSDVGFEGSGCAISTASASLMTESVRGKTREEIDRLATAFTTLVKGGGGNGLGKLAVFSGVHEFPMRVKCATLCWHTVRAALFNNSSTVTTE